VTTHPSQLHAELATAKLATGKFRDRLVTAKGEARAQVQMSALRTLWFNTGTLCNLTCANCYIESSPRNDRLAYLSTAEVASYLDEIARDGLPTGVIGFTGGEPFMNPELIDMLALVLGRGFQAMVLTNAMKPMRKVQEALLALRHHPGLVIRVSIDHHTQAVHEAERGANSWAPTLDGLRWLAAAGFTVHVAGRHFTDEPEADLRAGFARLFAGLGVAIDAQDKVALTLFPEMDARVDVPEITTACWDILHKSPDDVMCASSRMVVKRRGAAAPSVVACTLLPYEPEFELGRSLRDAAGAVALNHPHCAKFCVLGGASCSRN
jgi:uncharacterized Fe-S cluster-containing radical SAM superfamily protein